MAAEDSLGRPGRLRGARSIAARVLLLALATCCWLGSARAGAPSVCSVTIQRVMAGNNTLYLNLAEVELLTSVSPLTKIPASSLNATLSSTFMSAGKSYAVAKCFDGVVSSNDSSVCVTGQADKAAKLTIVYPCASQLAAVRVYNRRDYGTNFIDSFAVTVQDASGACQTTRFSSLGSAQQVYDIPISSIATSAPASPPICLVTIQRVTPGTDRQYLNLAEVELFAGSPPTKVRASSLRYNMSSTFGGSYRVAKCFDGIVSTNDSSVCVTGATDTAAMLRVVYPCASQLAAVRVYNRRDYGTNFIDSFSITVQDALGVRQTTRFLALGRAQQVYNVPVAQTACPGDSPSDACAGVVCNATACRAAAACSGGTCGVGAPLANWTSCTAPGIASGVCLAGNCSDPCAPNPCESATACLEAQACAVNGSAPGGFTCSIGAPKSNGTGCTAPGIASGVCFAATCIDPCAPNPCASETVCREAQACVVNGSAPGGFTCAVGAPKTDLSLCEDCAAAVAPGVCIGGECVDPCASNPCESATACLEPQACAVNGSAPGGFTCSPGAPKADFTLCAEGAVSAGVCSSGACVDPCSPSPCAAETACVYAQTCSPQASSPGYACSDNGPKDGSTACGPPGGTCSNGCTDPCSSVTCDPGSDCTFPQTCDLGTCVGGGPMPDGTSCTVGVRRHLLTPPAVGGICSSGSCVNPCTDFGTSPCFLGDECNTAEDCSLNPGGSYPYYTCSGSSEKTDGTFCQFDGTHTYVCVTGVCTNTCDPIPGACSPGDACNAPDACDPLVSTSPFYACLPGGVQNVGAACTPPAGPGHEGYCQNGPEVGGTITGTCVEPCAGLNEGDACTTPYGSTTCYQDEGAGVLACWGAG